MKFVYTIVEENQAYPNAYTTYKDALDAVKQKYNDLLNTKYDDEDENINEIPEKENTKSNFTELYIEKGIYINIYKLAVNSKTLRRHSVGGRYYKKNTQSNKKANKTKKIF